MRRFSLASLAASAFAAFALASAPSASAQETLAASCGTPAEVEGDPVLGDAYTAQIFSPSVTGTLTRAEVAVFEAFIVDSGFVVEIRTVDTSLRPTSVVLASAQFPDIEHFEVALLNAVFANPPTVVAGQTYALVVSRSNGTDRAFVGRNETGVCPFFALLSADGETWEAFANIDLLYRIFVTPRQGPLPECKGEPATVLGTANDDELIGTDRRDVIVALDGNDEVFGLESNDRICGNAGRDRLKGGRGKDTLFGQKGRDRLKGQKGRDRLRGGGGKDLCKGGKGDDSASKCEVERSV